MFMNSYERYKDRLTGAGLKVTPQRIAVLEALDKVHDHPTTDRIVQFVSKKNPGISHATVYKTLDTFVANGMLSKVRTEADKMRYDAIMEPHHHLYCAESDRIEDYYDKELDDLIRKHFKNKEIEGFSINDIKLQIVGNFNKEVKQSNK